MLEIELAATTVMTSDPCSQFPKYVLHRAATVQNPGSAEGREILCCLAFLGYLMKLHDESPVMTAFHDRGGVGQLAKARRIQAPEP